MQISEYNECEPKVTVSQIVLQVVRSNRAGVESRVGVESRRQVAVRTVDVLHSYQRVKVEFGQGSCGVMWSYDTFQFKFGVYCSWWRNSFQTLACLKQCMELECML